LYIESYICRATCDFERSIFLVRTTLVNDVDVVVLHVHVNGCKIDNNTSTVTTCIMIMLDPFTNCSCPKVVLPSTSRVRHFRNLIYGWEKRSSHRLVIQDEKMKHNQIINDFSKTLESGITYFPLPTYFHF